MRNTSRAFLLGPLLKGVSRSFYLTLRILPAGMRDPVGLAYLLARAADTIADTSLVPPDQRLALLLSLRERILGTGGDGADVALQTLMMEVTAQQTQADEKTLLESLGPALAVLSQLTEADRAAVRHVLTTLTDGMVFDLQTFPDERSGQIAALPNRDALDHYTYLVAGCVGEFWTTMTYAHLPGVLKTPPETMRDRGVRFGKALQLTNVLRDCGKDLRIGRCYLPTPMLTHAGLTPHDLLHDSASSRARPLLAALVHQALDHFRAALDYTLAIPRLSVRLRLACIWPIVIGLQTLVLLVRNDAWLDPHRVSKVRREEVYRILAYSLLVVTSNDGVRIWCERLMREVEAGLRVDAPPAADAPANMRE